MDIESAIKVMRAAAAADDTVIMEGAHGIGKSQAVFQFAKEDDYHVEALFLSHQEVGDLIGTPVTNYDSETNQHITTWSVPIWLQRMQKASREGKHCVLFLDELNRAPIDVRQSALQLVLDRKIHEHSLPVLNGQRTIVVAAINPSDDYQVDELDIALMDRFLSITIDVDAKSWLEWARKNSVNKIVRDFIAEFPDRIHLMPKDGTKGATPRSWEKLGKHIDNMKNIDKDILFHIIKGKVGTAVGSQFYSFIKDYADVIKIEDIEKLINDNKSKYSKIEDLAELVTEIMSDTESIQKMEIANQMADLYTKKDVFPLLVYLYSLEIEIRVAFIKRCKIDNKTVWAKIVELDDELNNKKLFSTILTAAERK